MENTNVEAMSHKRKHDSLTYSFQLYVIIIKLHIMLLQNDKLSDGLSYCYYSHCHWFMCWMLCAHAVRWTMFAQAVYKGHRNTCKALQISTTTIIAWSRPHFHSNTNSYDSLFVNYFELESHLQVIHCSQRCAQHACGKCKSTATQRRHVAADDTNTAPIHAWVYTHRNKYEA